MISLCTLLPSPALYSLLIAGTLASSLTALGCSSDGDGNDGASGGAASGGAASGGAASGGAASGGAASGGAASGGDSSTGGNAMMDYPADSSLATIEAYLAAESYKLSPWVGETISRVPDPTSGNPHKASVRVFYNTAGAGATPLMELEAGTEAPTNAMSVKEIYDESDTLIGKAVRWKTGEGSSYADWTSYCTASAESLACTGAAETYPIYEQGGLNSCAACHGTSSFFAPHP